MGLSGSQVAREAADLVITDDDLNLVTRAVKRVGRSTTTFESRRLSRRREHLRGDVVLAGLAAFPGLGIPLFPIQLLWINLLTDGLPALALGFDRPRHDLAFRPAGFEELQLLPAGQVGDVAGSGRPARWPARSVPWRWPGPAGASGMRRGRSCSSRWWFLISSMPSSFGCLSKGNCLQREAGWPPSESGWRFRWATVLGPFTDFFQVVTSDSGSVAVGDRGRRGAGLFLGTVRDDPA